VGSAVLYVFGLFVLYLALPFGYATWRVPQVDQGWASSFESRQAFAAHLPKTATSAGAWQLHELTRPLGIDMVGETARSDRLDAIGAFAMAQQRAPDDAPRTAPAEVTQFLDEHARHLGAIETDLLEGSALSWERDLEAGFDAPQPDFRGHRYLQCMLLARAIEEGRRGNSAAADRSLYASWILNRSLLARHELIAQLTAILIALTENAVLRVLPASPVQSADRVLAHDFPPAFLRAFQAEAFLHSDALVKLLPASTARNPNRVRSAGLRLLRPAINVLAAPWLKVSMAGYSERMRMTAELLRENDDPCTLDLRAMSRAAEDALPHWNWLARSVIKDAPLAWDVLTVVRLDGEFTRLVMEARRDSGNIRGSSPIVSTVCKSVSWIRTAGRDGTATIAAQPPRPLRYETGSRHWTFTLGPAS
jgi:hypothetical protein